MTFKLRRRLILAAVCIAPSLTIVLVSPSLVRRGRLAGDEPHLQIVGHYVPLPSPVRTLAIGSGEAADILLTEPGIDELHGWLVPGDIDWKYVHSSASMGAEQARLPVDHQFIKPGDSISVTSAPAGSSQSASANVETLTVRNATAVLIGNRTDTGLLLLQDGQHIALAKGSPPVTLMSCHGRVGLSVSEKCSADFRPLESVAGNILASLGRPAAIGGDVSKLLPESDARRKTLEAMRIGVPLFAHRYAWFISTDGREYRTVPPAASTDVMSNREGFSIRAPSTAVSVLVEGRWFHFPGRRKLLIRRVGNSAQSVWLAFAGARTPLLVGELTHIVPGSRWILGATEYKLTLPAPKTAPQVLALVPQERSDRFHYLLSLSAGRLNAFGIRQPVPLCGQGRVHLVGLAAGTAAAAGEGDDDAKTVTMALRLPSWAAAVHPRVVKEHARELDLGYACVNAGELALTAPSVVVPLQGGPLSAVRPVSLDGRTPATIKPGTRFQVAGQLLEFRLGTPRFEQLSPLIGFALFLGVMGLGAVVAVDRGLGNALSRTTPDVLGSDDLVTLIAVIAALMTSLMMSGVLLLMRMAASDRLIGKPDYVHRQIFMCSLAMILFVAILAAAVGDSTLAPETKLSKRVIVRLKRAAGVFIAGGAMIVLWILIDAAGWLLAAGDWIASSGSTRAAVLRSWWRSLTLSHLALFAAALVCLGVLTLFEKPLLKRGEKLGLDRVWRLGIGPRLRVGLVCALLLALGIVYEVLCRPSWLTLACWLIVGFLAGPLAAPLLAGGMPLRPGKVRTAFIAGFLLLSAARLPRWDSIDFVELLFFLLLSAAVAFGVALAVVLAATFPGKHQVLIRRLGVDIGNTLAPPHFVEHHVQLLAAGFGALALGLVLQSGRYLFGLKPAEFAVWFLATGLAMFLARHWDLVQTRISTKPPSRARFLAGLLPLFLAVAAATALLFVPGWRLLSFSVAAVGMPFAAYAMPRSGWKHEAVGRWLSLLRTPITTLFLLLSIELAVLVLYAAEGDFGPLLVLVPAVLFTVVYWVVTPDASTVRTAGRRLLERTVILALLVSATVGLAAAGYVLVTSETVQNVPFIGTSVHRAADRLVTYVDPWYTSSGSWSVNANWIAAGLADEHYLSNLHSDLALIAFRESFGVRHTYGVVFLYIVIASLLGFLAASFQHSHVELASGNDETNAIRKSALVTSLALWFATFYLLIEVLVHGLTNFNFIPQTGLALPWVSSGGSAAIAFSGLTAIVLAMAAQVYVRMDRPARGTGDA